MDPVTLLPQVAGGLEGMEQVAGSCGGSLQQLQALLASCGASTILLSRHLALQAGGGKPGGSVVAGGVGSAAGSGSSGMHDGAAPAGHVELA